MDKTMLSKEEIIKNVKMLFENKDYSDDQRNMSKDKFIKMFLALGGTEDEADVEYNDIIMKRGDSRGVINFISRNDLIQYFLRLDGFLSKDLPKLSGGRKSRRRRRRRYKSRKL